MKATLSLGPTLLGLAIPLARDAAILIGKREAKFASLYLVRQEPEELGQYPKDILVTSCEPPHHFAIKLGWVRFSATRSEYVISLNSMLGDTERDALAHTYQAGLEIGKAAYESASAPLEDVDSSTPEGVEALGLDQPSPLADELLATMPGNNETSCADHVQMPCAMVPVPEAAAETSEEAFTD